jgi:hypothetical protein
MHTRNAHIRDEVLLALTKPKRCRTTSPRMNQGRPGTTRICAIEVPTGVKSMNGIRLADFLRLPLPSHMATRKWPEVPLHVATWRISTRKGDTSGVEPARTQLQNKPPPVSTSRKRPRSECIAEGKKAIANFAQQEPQLLETLSSKLKGFEKEFPHSLSFQAAMQRLLPILTTHKSQWAHNLKAVARVADWSATTTMTAWRSLLTAATAVGLTVDDNHRLATKMLARKVHVEIQRQPRCLTAAEAAVLAKLKGASETILVPLLLAWSLAQRPSDIVRLAAADVRVEQEFVCLTVRRGKVTHSIGPFSVHLSLDSSIAKRLLQYIKMRSGAEFLFTNRDTEQERRHWAEQALKTLRRVHPELEQRSVRRGALREMSAQGATEEELLRLTQHTTIRRLNTYLGEGRLNFQQARKTSALALNIE